jgi:small subunit ribosomal protein S1
VKQLEQDPMGQFQANNTRGTIVKGTVKEVDAKGATIDLGDGVEGYLAARDIAHERVEDASQKLKVGDEVEAKIVGTDRKSRLMQLSIKAKDEAETQEAMAEYNKSATDASSGTTKLGALLREQLENKSE